MVHPASLKRVLGLFTRDIATVCGIDHPPQCSAEAKGRVELQFHAPYMCVCSMLQDELHHTLFSLYNEYCTAVDLNSKNARARELF